MDTWEGHLCNYGESLLTYLSVLLGNSLSAQYKVVEGSLKNYG